MLIMIISEYFLINKKYIYVVTNYSNICMKTIIKLRNTNFCYITKKISKIEVNILMLKLLICVARCLSISVLDKISKSKTCPPLNS